MNLTIHCQDSMLETIKQSGLDYIQHLNEIDVVIPYTKGVEMLNNYYQDDEDLVNHFGLNYDEVYCIELN